MKKNTLSLVLAGAFVVGLLAMSPSVQAGDPGRKLGRGLANTLLGITELPRTIAEVNREQGPGTAATWGPIKGIVRVIERELAGVVEIILFPVPWPKEYAPIIQPEWPWDFEAMQK